MYFYPTATPLPVQACSLATARLYLGPQLQDKILEGPGNEVMFQADQIVRLSNCTDNKGN